MTKKHSTKKALVASILALCMCFTMLVGTTFAWFTDSVTSTGNVIKSGTLDIEFENYNYETGVWETASQNKIFNYDKWEPGYTQKVNLRVINNGTLALKWMAAITTSQSLSKLADVINVYVRANDKFNAEAESSVAGYINDIDTRDLTAAVTNGDLAVCTLRQFIENCSAVTKGNLKAGDTAYLGLILQMDPEAGNDYQNLDLGGKFDITILATQMASEEDSFDKTYDANAQFPTFVWATTDVVKGSTEPYELALKNPAGGKQGSATIPAGAVDPDATAISATVKKVDTDGTFTLYDAESQAVTTLDVKVTGLKENNDVKVKIIAHVPANLTGVTLYHKNDPTPIDCAYWITDGVGYLAFESAEFSPFNIVYDYVPVEEELTDATLPVAKVTENPELANTPIEWTGFGGLNPTNPNQTLEAVYTFKAPHDAETVDNSAFKYWYCDYYVMCDKDIVDDAIVLGGNYGEFGWVGFNSPVGETIPANTEVPLLGTVGGTWTYEAIVTLVSEFKCGVAHYDCSLDGATFTVMLRLTNPDDETDYYTVNTVKYTFPTCAQVSDNTELKAAIESGKTSISLNGTVDLAGAQGAYINLNKDVTISGGTIKGTGWTGELNYGVSATDGNIVFDGVTFDTTDWTTVGWAKWGISVNVSGSANVTFKNCTFKGTQCPIYQSCADSVITLENCKFESSTTAIQCEIYSGDFQLGQNLIVKNCDFTGLTDVLHIYDYDKDPTSEAIAQYLTDNGNVFTGSCKQTCK